MKKEKLSRCSVCSLPVRIIIRMKCKYCILLFFCLMFSASALWAQQKATPKPGEGISAFLLRHNRAPKKYYNDFIRLNEAKLGKGKTLKMGITYLIPPAKKSPKAKTAPPSAVSGKPAKGENKRMTATRRRTDINEPLFGKLLSKVKVTSTRLAGTCFYVVSGHGGPDPGAIGRIGKHELHEDEYAYDIALRLARNLMQEGAEVRIIIQDAKDGIRDNAYLSNSKRETCMGTPIPLNQVQRLKQRCNKINALYRKDRENYKYCRAIFIHVDSRSKGTQTDVFFYHSKRRAESKKLANNMKTTFESKYGKHQPNRGFSGTVSGRNLYVLAHSTPVSVFVELGNIQNALDQKRLVIPSNRQALANWLMEGFLKDYKGM